MTTPGWYALALLGLGIYRICRLVGWDDISAPVRARLVMSDAMHSQWTWALNAIEATERDPWAYRYADAFLGAIMLTHRNGTLPPLVGQRVMRNDVVQVEAFARGVVPFSKSRWYVSKMIRCPWCLGWWISLLVWIAYEAAPRGTLIAMSLFAVSALPGLVAKNLDKGD